MNIANIFYLVGIIYMMLNIVLFIVLIILLFYIKKKLLVIYEKIDEKITVVNNIVSNPKQAAVSVGAIVVEKVFDQLISLFKFRKKDIE